MPLPPIPFAVPEKRPIGRFNGREAVIVDAIRTPRGRGRPLASSRPGALGGVHPQELVAQLLTAILERTGLRDVDVNDLVLGCVTREDEQGANIARHAVLSAGWDDRVAGTTLTRACGSGLQALHYAVMAVMTGAQDVVVAGGVESMSRVPMGSDGASESRGAATSNGGGVGDGRNAQLRRRIRQVPQGISADLITTLEGLTRAEVDAFALLSQQRAAIAIADGRFAPSLIPVREPRTGTVLLDGEEFPRATTAAGLAALPTSFESLGATALGSEDVALLAELEPSGRQLATLDSLALAQLRARGAVQEEPRVRAAISSASEIRHVHTAGNSSGIADGAAALLVTSADFARAHGLRARARLRSCVSIGSDPVLMLTAPTPASRLALAHAGMDANEVDLWEINEAFAAVPLKTMRDLDPTRINVNGGAIALGHPLGATGAILVGTALDDLERRGLGTALVALCIAGGQAIAAVLERL